MQLERVGQFMTGQSSTIHHVLARLLLLMAAILCPMTRCCPVPDTVVDGININIQRFGREAASLADGAKTNQWIQRQISFQGVPQPAKPSHWPSSPK
jgi:hypothetical protein